MCVVQTVTIGSWAGKAPVPQKGGAMENPGLITYGTNTILGKPGERSIALERGYLGIAAHELGHIWTYPREIGEDSSRQ